MNKYQSKLIGAAFAGTAILSPVASAVTTTLNGDTLVSPAGSEVGNLKVSGSLFTLGGYYQSQYNYGYGQMKIYNEMIDSYSSNIYFSADAYYLNWSWKSDNSYSYGGPQMTLDYHNTLTLYNAGGDTQKNIVIDPGDHYYTPGPRITVAGSVVLTAATAPAALASNFIAATPNQSFVRAGTYTGANNVPTTGAGARMMWYPEKAAFRAGRVTSNLWDEAYIGINSTAFGYNTRSSGAYSTAMGSSSTASGANSTALGNLSIASGSNSTAAGYGSTASGPYSTALGTSTASGNYSTAIGNSAASGSYATSMGKSSATGFASVAIGQNNEMRTTAPGTTAWQANNQNSVFEVGIGLSTTTPKNALTVLQDGSVEVGKATAGDNSVPLVIKADGSLVVAKPQGDISMGAFGN